MASFWDLRDQVHAADSREAKRDCASFMVHPIAIILIFVIGIAVVLWGVWSAASYLAGRDRNPMMLWYNSSLVFLAITILAFALPYRLRFGYNAFGLLFIILILQYALIMILFPINWLTHEQIEAAVYCAKLAAEKEKLTIQNNSGENTLVQL